MKAIVLLAAGIAAASPFASLAQPQAQTPLPGVEVTGHAPQPYPLTFLDPAEVRRLHGVYDMDNGMEVPIDVRGRVLYVNLDGRITALRAVTRDVFLSRDGQMALALADIDLPTVAISYSVRGRAPVMMAGGLGTGAALARKE
ncbi:hypothetical protein E4L96_17900 [Massilia arenosa]|uniref:Uncharacterized protein n=1 Tax=Zemynaea arenosa TaxID=2561931 RepID=A0A4Y9S2N9_9BURK|nr:hypothetical protein [Massilia arenosa]TFW15626.1 hypothetical protein E4L96_17900 [Massilia arenosa]